jgi:peroxiredoxin
LAQLSQDYAAFKEMNAEVVVITSDPVPKVREYLQTRRIPFPLLSDPGRAVADQYGARVNGEEIPRPSVFVLDRKGVIRFLHVGRNPNDRIPNEMVLTELLYLKD